MLSHRLSRPLSIDPIGPGRRCAGTLVSLIGLLLLTLAAPALLAAELKFGWDPVNDERVAVYELSYGSHSGAYEQSLTTTTDSVTVTGLREGATYYLAVRACDALRSQCSTFSEELSVTVPVAPVEPPKAGFTAGTTTGKAPLTVVFTDRSSGEITSRNWQFGDGGTASDATLVAYSYTRPGRYQVQLSVTGPGGSDRATLTETIVVTAPEPEATKGDGTLDPTNSVDDGSWSLGRVVEASDLQVTDRWQRVEFERPFADPVVVVKSLSANDDQPAVARIKDVDRRGFSIRIQEWDYLDDRHQEETVGYLVMERGRHRLDNGSWVEAGSSMSRASGGYRRVRFGSPFLSRPVVMGSLVTQNRSQAITTRLRRIDTNGFQFVLQGEEAHRRYRGREMMNYIAWEPGTGALSGHLFAVGRTAREVDHRSFRLGYPAPFDQAPVFLADLQTAHGGNTANLRWEDKTEWSVDVWVDEEQSRDEEIRHTTEEIGYILIETTNTSNQVLEDNRARVSPVESGELTLSGDWQLVDFARPFDDPVIIVKPLSGNGAQPALVQVGGVDRNGFRVRIQEWEYQNGRHLDETVGYLVIERGHHRLEDGRWIEAGRFDTAATSAFDQVRFEAPFAVPPVVISTIVTRNRSEAVVARLHDIDNRGFRLLLQGQEAGPRRTRRETVAYLAWEPGSGMLNGRRFDVGRTPRAVHARNYRLRYPNAFAKPPIFLADMQTTFGLDTANLRWKNKSERAIDIWVDEEQSQDKEVNHTSEVVGFILH